MDPWGYTVTNALVHNNASTFDVLVAFNVYTSEMYGPYNVYVRDGQGNVIANLGTTYIETDFPFMQLGTTIAGSAPDGAGYYIDIE